MYLAKPGDLVLTEDGYMIVLSVSALRYSLAGVSGVQYDCIPEKADPREDGFDDVWMNPLGYMDNECIHVFSGQ
jgi:hypothetical protein